MASAILTKGGWSITQNLEDFLVAWATAENSGGSNTGGVSARFNMLDSEQPALNPATETTFNSAGVKNYKTLAVGVTCTVRALNNGYYTHIVDGLAANETAESLAQLTTLNTWGTGKFPTTVVAVRADRSRYYTISVGTTSTAPIPKGTKIMATAIGTGYIVVTGVATGHKFCFTAPIADRASTTAWSIVDLRDVAKTAGIADTTTFTS